MASIRNSVTIHETIRVSPSTNSATEFCLPLTFFDMLWLNMPRAESLFFYKVTELTPELFNSVILPKLNHSLSLTLLHYLPLAGKLKWPPHAPKPAIYYSLNDAVSVSVAESKADFNRLSSNEIREAVELRPLVPELFTSDDVAELLSIQITMFPNQGFSIGFSNDHVIIDAHCLSMFMKSWVHICKKLVKEEEDHPLLPAALTPLFDRTLINDPSGTDMYLAKSWLDFHSSSRSWNIWPHDGQNSNSVRATFELTREDIKKLRDKVLSFNEFESKQLRLSTFVLTCAYVFVCLVKARGGESDRSVHFGFVADYKNRLDPPVPMNYIGNCVASHIVFTKARDFMAENGVGIVAEKISDGIKELESKGVVEQIKETLEKFMKVMSEPQQQSLGVSWSPRLDVYGFDFGWGRPKKMEIVSIDRGGAISIAKSRDEDGGAVEVGVVLDKQEMESFGSLFFDGLRNL
ncbi:hypothetical protein ACOSP7_006311 [Xanthoceras sorbifolium]